MKHLMNCHGEWNMLFACATTMPIMGVWLKFKLGGYYDKQQSKSSSDTKL